MIEYRPDLKGEVKDTYSTYLREAAEYFAGERIQMLGEGFREILGDQTLFESYVTKLARGLSAEETEQINQLLENARVQILSEASISGIQPIASLSMPTVRKMWSRVGLKNALPTEPVKMPKFTISYMEPYMINPDGTRIPLPQALMAPNNIAEKHALDSDPIAMPADDFDLLTASGGSKAIGDSIDPVFFIQKVTVRCLDENEENPEDVEVEVNFKLETSTYSIYGEVAAAHTDGTVTKDTFFGHVDLISGLISASSLRGNIRSFVVKGWLSSENNTKSQSVSFDIKRKNVDIGTGGHINAPLPIEWLQDTMAMYNIDGALEVVDLMSNVVGAKLEREIIEYLETSFKNAGEPYKGTFNLRPSPAFAGRPKDWRDELRTVIDHFAYRIKKESRFSNGKFVLMGSPVDMHLIPNVEWVFNHVTDENGGVEVNFDLGAYSGSNRYELVSSDYFNNGKIRMIFIPSSPKYMTYKYYPYTFNVEKGYLDPNMPHVPSIMMTKRHTVEELIPLACEITLINNDGTMPASAD
jgi:hypothetical protein